MINIERPKQSWAEFNDQLPKGGRAPGLREIAERWSEREELKGKDDSGAEVVRGVRSKENGEERAYQAFILGVMEPEEARYFGMLDLRVDVLTRLAVVPVLRDLHTAIEYLSKERMTLQENRLIEFQDRLDRAIRLSGVTP